MTRLRVAIVDDEAPARDRLLDLLAPDEELEVVAVCDGGRAAIAAVSKDHPDLLFLDVAMPEIDGFDVIEAVGPERMPAVIFVTAFDEYAVRAFEVNALDYLLKPFDRPRFEQALGRAKAALKLGRRARLEPLLQGRPVDRLLVSEGDKVEVVRTTDIDWMEAAGNFVDLHLGKRTLLLRSTLKALEARLDAATFLRIHRDTIVHIDRIRTLHRWTAGRYRLVLEDGTERPVGRLFQARLEQRLGKM